VRKRVSRRVGERALKRVRGRCLGGAPHALNDRDPCHQPDEIVYVGDRLDNDLRPAATTGLRAVFVRLGPWGYIISERDTAHLELNSLAELPAALRRCLSTDPSPSGAGSTEISGPRMFRTTGGRIWDLLVERVFRLQPCPACARPTLSAGMHGELKQFNFPRGLPSTRVNLYQRDTGVCRQHGLIGLDYY
jgi:hypothetical protein